MNQCTYQLGLIHRDELLRHATEHNATGQTALAAHHAPCRPPAKPRLQWVRHSLATTKARRRP